MNRLSPLRRSLGLKILLSHLIIVLVGVVVLAGTATFQAPNSLLGHIQRMQEYVGEDPALAEDVRNSFTEAVFEILFVAAAAALAASVVVSTYVARRIVTPIRQMMQASQRVAAGEYKERVPVPSDDELGELAVSLNRMSAALDEVEERRLALIGDVAHELRTPLNNITGVMEGLIDGVLPDELETYLSVQHEVSRLRRLVQDLQEISRAEAGQLRIEARPLRLEESIEAAAARLGPQFAEKGVALDLQLPGDLPPAYADPDRVLQVLLNLLGNALQYTPAGGRVTVRSREEDSDLITEIQDTGIGIAAEHLPYVFERFYRVDKSRSRAGGGSGIGLTIAKHLVEAHGGSIRAVSAGPNQGSTLIFTLPRAI